jgi:AIPR protein
MVNLQFHKISDISNVDDIMSSRRVYVAQLSIDQIIDINTDENVRNYTGENKKTDVHKKILQTLMNNSERFSVLNGGIVVVTDEVTIDEKNQTVKLKSPSIINGAQTQGVIKEFIALLTEQGKIPPKIFVKVEIIQTYSEDLRREITIARNHQNKVQMLSIYGVQGVYADLSSAIKKHLTKFKLQESEDERSDDYIPVDKLVQILIALTPMSLGVPDSVDKVNRTFCYSSKAKCLRLYETIWRSTDDCDDAQFRNQCKKVYDAYIKIAPQAWLLYKRWQSNPLFIKFIREDGEDREGFDRSHVFDKKTGTVLISDGILFPILTTLSNYVVVSRQSGWTIDIPAAVEKKIIESALFAYNQFSDSNPQSMGKSKQVYAYINKHHNSR